MVCFKKRGLSYADWAMSFALFALYLIWFFLFVIPMYSPKEATKLPISDLRNNFFELNSWQVEQTPLFIESNLSASNEAIIITNPLSGGKNNYYMQNRMFDFDEGRLITIANTSSVVYVLRSEHNYSMPLIPYDLSANAFSAEVGRMVANFDSSVLQELSYKGEKKIKSFSINKRPISSSFNSHPMYAKYKFTAREATHTSYVVGDNLKIINYINPESETKINLNLSLHKYKKYYADSKHFGSIDYDSSDCESFESNYIDFYDDNGVSFVFDKEVDIKMCHEDKLELEFSFRTDEEFKYVIIVHEDDFKETIYYGYAVETGLAQAMTGLSERKLISTKKLAYADLREALQFPSNRNFNITVFDVGGADYTFGRSAEEVVEVEAEDFELFVLDEYGSQESVIINVQGW